MAPISVVRARMAAGKLEKQGCGLDSRRGKLPGLDATGYVRMARKNKAPCFLNDQTSQVSQVSRLISSK